LSAVHSDEERPLAVSPIRRGGNRNFFQECGPTAKCRRNDAVPATGERVQQMLEVVAMQDTDWVGHVNSTTRAASM
jgi:hypothetical protein